MKKIAFVLLSLVMTCILFGCKDNDPVYPKKTNFYAIAGVVFGDQDSVNNNVRIDLKKDGSLINSKTVNLDEVYVFDKLSIGKYTLEVEGFSSEVEISDEQRWVICNFNLSAVQNTYRVRGFVGCMDKDSLGIQKPVISDTLSLYKVSTQLAQRIVSGDYSFPLPGPGDYVLRSSAEGFESAVAYFTVFPKQYESIVHILMKRPGESKAQITQDGAIESDQLDSLKGHFFGYFRTLNTILGNEISKVEVGVDIPYDEKGEINSIIDLIEGATAFSLSGIYPTKESDDNFLLGVNFAANSSKSSLKNPATITIAIPNTKGIVDVVCDGADRIEQNDTSIIVVTKNFSKILLTHKDALIQTDGGARSYTDDNANYKDDEKFVYSSKKPRFALETYADAVFDYQYWYGATFKNDSIGADIIDGLALESLNRRYGINNVYRQDKCTFYDWANLKKDPNGAVDINGVMYGPNSYLSNIKVRKGIPWYFEYAMRQSYKKHSLLGNSIFVYDYGVAINYVYYGNGNPNDPNDVRDHFGGGN